MVVNYLWNITLCEALYPALNALEIALRNSLCDALARRYGTECWFDRPGILIRLQPSEIDRAREKIKSKGKPETPGRIIAELGFGFWTTLLSGPYDRHLWKPSNYALLREVFPHIPYKVRTRTFIYKRYNHIRFLRNRAFHFEPIWTRSSLPDDHKQIIEAIGWISPTLRDTVAFCDRFPYVYERGRRDLEDKIRTYLAS